MRPSSACGAFPSHASACAGLLTPHTSAANALKHTASCQAQHSGRPQRRPLLVRCVQPVALRRCMSACGAMRQERSERLAWCRQQHGRRATRLAARMKGPDEEDDAEHHKSDENNEDNEGAPETAPAADEDDGEREPDELDLADVTAEDPEVLGSDGDDDDEGSSRKQQMAAQLESSDEEDEEGADSVDADEEGAHPDLLTLDDLIGDTDGFSAGALDNMEAADLEGSDSDAEAEEAMEEVQEPQYETPPTRSYTLGDLFEAAELGTLARQQLTTEQLETTLITDIQFSPERVDDGCLFVCIDGLHFDGHDFTECSVENGAAAFVMTQPAEEHDLPEGFPVLVVDNVPAVLGKLARAFCDNPSEKLATVGVTGSAGKTTTSWLIRSIFEELGQITGMLGSLEYAIAEDRMTDEGDLWQPEEEDPTLKLNSSTPYHLTVYQGKYKVPQSTPNALAMQKILAGVADRGGASAVVECTTTGLQEGRIDDVDFDVAVFTNATEENVDDGQGMRPPETINEHVDKMAKLFSKLSEPDRQRAVINVDDPYADIIKQAGIQVPVVTFATRDRDADVFAEKIKMTSWETDILIRTPLGRLEIITPLIGRANVYNVLAAVAVGVSLNVNLKSIVAGIEAVDVVPGRTEMIDEGQKFPVIVDSASTPTQLSRLLDMVREAGARRILTVFGAQGQGGAREPGTRPEDRPRLGEILHHKSDFVFVTNNNPRLESPSEVAQDLVAGFPQTIHNFEAFPGRPHWLCDLGSPGDPIGDPAEVAYPTHLEQEQRINNQGMWRRSVSEDRFTAIRAAIGTAQGRDAVVIAGKGAEDFQEFGDPETGEVIRGWFDDRVESRNALSKLGVLSKLVPDLDRKELPWLSSDETDERPERVDSVMGVDTRQFKS